MSKNFISIIITIFTPILLFPFVEIEKSLFLITFLYIFLILIFRKLIFSKVKYFFKFKSNQEIYRINIFNIFIIFIFLIVTQNYLLHYETISWDVPSYLVATYDVQTGNLPFTTQWESKGPLLIYIYYFLSELANKNFVYFKIINDLILFLVAINIYRISSKKTENKFYSLMTTLFFCSLMSMRWFIIEYSELYCLLFLSSAHLIYENNIFKKNKFYFIGILIALSSLVNQVTILFAIPYIIYLFFNSSGIKPILNLFFAGFFTHLIVLITYFFNDLFDVYIANFLFIPLGYTNAVSESSFYELRVFFREFFDYNNLLYLSIFTFLFLQLINIFKNFNLVSILSFVNINLVLSIVIYFIGAHNYSNHLFYFLYFLPFLAFEFTKNTNFYTLIVVLLFFTSISIFNNTFTESYFNLKNINTVQDEYPLYKLSKTIDANFEKDYDIFALEYVLILYYLDKPNYSYIVHPTNHFETYITDPLINTGKIVSNQVNVLLDKEPDVILCNSVRIHKGAPLINENFSCNFNDYQSKYFSIDTSIFREDKKVEYYFDPYKEMNVFIKIDN